MKNYVGTKFIEAKEMTRGEYNDYRGWKIPENENPADEGYLAKYSDGHENWLPKKHFEETFKMCDGMTFGIAVELLKQGFKVARKKWVEGKCLFLVEGVNIHSSVDVISLKTPPHSFDTIYSASQADILAEDWIIVE